MDKKSNLPFFARFLESQELEQVSGGLMHTMKFPSDGDEQNFPPVHTMKYPSDSDESTGGPIHTMKYPSDGDELTA